MKFLFDKGIVKQKEGKISPQLRQNFTTLSDLEIVSAFNAELQGICNYYGLSVNFCRLNYFTYFMEYSCYADSAIHSCDLYAELKYSQRPQLWRPHNDYC